MAENLEKSIIPQESSCNNTSVTSSTADGHFRSRILLGEGQIDATFDDKLKEEIAAQTLILTALGNGENNCTNDSSQTSSSTAHLHHEGDHVFVSSDNDTSQVSNNVLVATQNLKSVDDFNQDQHSFDVSHAIGVEMIAIQQPPSDSNVHQLASHVGTIITRENSQQQEAANDDQCGYKTENRDENDLLNRQLAGSLYGASIAASSPVVLNAIAIKGENGVTELQEIQFDATASTSEIQIEHTEVEAITEQEDDQTDKGALMIINQAINSPETEIADAGNQGDGNIPTMFRNKKNHTGQEFIQAM